MPKAVAYQCGICGTELHAADGKSAFERARQCEALGRPPFGYRVGDQIPYVRIWPTGQRTERSLTIVECFYVRQTHLVRRGKPRQRKVAIHVPSYRFSYMDDRGREHEGWCVERTLDEFKAGPVRGIRNLFLL